MRFVPIFLATAAILSISNANAKQPFNIASGGTQKIGIGRCYMGECSYSKIIKNQIVHRDSSKTRVKATLLGGTSYHPNGDYPKRIPQNIQWNKKAHQVTAVCSYESPQLVMDGQVDELSFEFVPSILENSANLYFQICHNDNGGYFQGAKKFGYQ